MSFESAKNFNTSEPVPPLSDAEAAMLQRVKECAAVPEKERSKEQPKDAYEAAEKLLDQNHKLSPEQAAELHELLEQLDVNMDKPSETWTIGGHSNPHAEKLPENNASDDDAQIARARRAADPHGLGGELK